MKKQGFTIIELLVVVTIFSVIMVTIYGVFYAGLVVCRRNDDVPLQERKIIMNMERLADDLRQVSYVIDFNMEGLLLNGDSQTLAFVSLSDGDLGHCEYKFNPINNKLTLTRSQIDREDEKLDVGKPRILMQDEDINSFSFSFLGFDAEVDEYFWAEEWAEEEKLPLAVKAEMYYGDQVYTKRVSIFQ